MRGWRSGRRRATGSRFSLGFKIWREASWQCWISVCAGQPWSLGDKRLVDRCKTLYSMFVHHIILGNASSARQAAVAVSAASGTTS